MRANLVVMTIYLDVDVDADVDVDVMCVCIYICRYTHTHIYIYICTFVSSPRKCSCKSTRTRIRQFAPAEYIVAFRAALAHVKDIGDINIDFSIFSCSKQESSQS